MSKLEPPASLGIKFFLRTRDFCRKVLTCGWKPKLCVAGATHEMMQKSTLRTSYRDALFRVKFLVIEIYVNR